MRLSVTYNFYQTLKYSFSDTKYKIRTYDPIRVKDVLYHWANFAYFSPQRREGEAILPKSQLHGKTFIFWKFDVSE